ncbi:MAG: metallophosphoesterase [Clostridia bacterium]|nr:metallophosphoesterase [Clostridia bacterium]
MITVSKQKSKDFTILNLSDPHLITNEWEDGHIGKISLVSTVNTLMNEVKPDLITISGDISVGKFCEAYTNFAEFINSFGVSWAVVWGNHDHQEGEHFIEQYEKEYQGYSHCLYQPGPKELGHGNYVIAITEEDKIVHGIIMMDTHDRVPYPTEEHPDGTAWAKITPAQIAWYREVVIDLQQKGCNNTTVIAHMPIYVYREAYQKAFRQDIDPDTTTFEKSLENTYWNEGFEDAFGMNHEGICSYPEDEGMFAAMQQLGSTKLYLCGHDHCNCTVIPYEGIRLMFSLKTGIAGYSKDPFNGGSVLTLHSDGTIDVRQQFCDKGVTDEQIERFMEKFNKQQNNA